MPTPLLTALYQRQNERVAEIMAAKPELDIFEATAVGNVQRVDELIAMDKSLVDAAADDAFHPLHLAAYFGYPAIANHLIAAGADVNATAGNASSVRPIHSAIAARQLEVMRMLLEAGASPNVKQAGGWAPLHSAAHQGNDQAVDLLLNYAADPEQKADDGRTPVDMATEIGRSDLARRLRDAVR